MEDNIFICYAREDNEFVASFLLEFESESSNSPIKLVPKVDNSIIDLGEKYKEKIETVIENSSAAVLFISHNLSKSSFIKDIEIPAILRQKELNPSFLILPIFIDETQEFDQRIMSYHAINTGGTALRNLDGDLRKLIINNSIKQIYSYFEHEVYSNDYSKTSKNSSINNKTNVQKYLSWRNLLIATFLVGLFALMWNPSSEQALIESEESEIIVEERGANVFISNLRTKVTQESVGEISNFTDLDYVNHATWICSSLKSGIEGYFVYDALWYLIAFDLQKYNVSGELIDPQEFGTAQYYIFNFANDYFCDSKTPIYDIEKKYNLHTVIVNNSKRSDSEKWNFKSKLLNNLLPEVYASNQEELLDTLDPSPSLVGFFYDQNDLYENWIEDSCADLLLRSTDEILDFIQSVFDMSSSLDDQNSTWDIFTIQFEIIPQIYCEEYVDTGILYSTYLYLIDKKF
jgi:hypothetical protein